MLACACVSIKKSRAPLVRRRRRRADADAPRSAQVEARAVGARPRRRLVGARHVGGAHAPDLVQREVRPQVQVAHQDALGRRDARVDVPGAHGRGQVVDLRGARRAQVRERHELEEDVQRVVVAARGVVDKEVDQLRQAHRRVAADGQRDGRVAQARVAPVGQRLGRIVQKVDLAVDNGQQRLRQVVLLDRRFRQLGGGGDAAKVAARVAAVGAVLHEHAQLLVDLQAQRQVARGRGVGLVVVAQRLLGEQRAALKVALRRKAGAARGGLARVGHALGNGRSGERLRRADHELGAQHDEAARNAGERRVQRAVGSAPGGALLDGVKDALELVPLCEFDAARLDRVQVHRALHDARQQARLRVARRGVAHGEAPHGHRVVGRAVERPQVAGRELARVQGGVAGVVGAANGADVQLDAILRVATAPDHNLGHAGLGGHHQARDGLGRLDGVAVGNVDEQRIVAHQRAVGRLAHERVHGGVSGGGLGLRDHHLQDGRVLRVEGRLPVVEKPAAHGLHDARAGRALALQRERLLVVALALGHVALDRGERALRVVARGRARRFVVVVDRNAIVLLVVLDALALRAVRGSGLGVLRALGRVHARAARNLGVGVALKEKRRRGFHVPHGRGAHELAQARIREHVHQQHPRGPNVDSLGVVIDAVAHGAQRVHLLRAALPQRSKVDLLARKGAHRLEKRVLREARGQRVRKQARRGGDHKDLGRGRRVRGHQPRSVKRHGRRRVGGANAVLLDADAVGRAHGNGHRRGLRRPRGGHVAQIVARRLLTAPARLLGLVHHRGAHRV